MLLFAACSQPGGKPASLKPDEPLVSPDSILSSYANFYYYKTDHLKLSVPYKAYDTALQEISRELFLQQYASGYLPLRLVSADSSIRYKLYKLPASVKPGVANAIAQYGEEQYKYFKREGEQYPVMAFTDINGTPYNKETTTGKTLVLKFWFIHCGVCVKEMPELNELQTKYSNRGDVQFISFAFDTADELRAFKKKTVFNYAVISVPESYMEGLGIMSYPTHMIINKKGNISKVMGTVGELADALEVETR